MAPYGNLFAQNAPRTPVARPLSGTPVPVPGMTTNVYDQPGAIPMGGGITGTTAAPVPAYPSAQLPAPTGMPYTMPATQPPATGTMQTLGGTAMQPLPAPTGMPYTSPAPTAPRGAPGGADIPPPPRGNYGQSANANYGQSAIARYANQTPGEQADPGMRYGQQQTGAGGGTNPAPRPTRPAAMTGGYGQNANANYGQSGARMGGNAAAGNNYWNRRATGGGSAGMGRPTDIGKPNARRNSTPTVGSGFTL